MQTRIFREFFREWRPGDIVGAVRVEPPLPVEYRGRKTGGRNFVWRIQGEKAVELDPRFDLFNKSPTGFNWGYGGSGPSQLALAICCDVVGDERALAVYQAFKRRVVANLPENVFVLTKRRCAEIIAELEAGQ